MAGFVLTDGDIEISPLKTVNDFYCEGSALHHCVFTMGYYKRKDSLILGAKVNGERTETIEVSLKDFSVSQCKYGQPVSQEDNEPYVEQPRQAQGRVQEGRCNVIL